MGQEVRGYEDLEVWQRGMDLAERVYGLTRSFPADEKFGLTAQLRRAAVSIPSNIAEGWGRGVTNEYLQFLRYARGSLYEVETQLRIAQRNGYLSGDDLGAALELTRTLSRMRLALMRALH
jgi:four helix bundle protein